MPRHASLKLHRVLPGALSACVTINVYFPAAAAEKAADKIIEDVWGADKPPSPRPSATTTSRPRCATLRSAARAAGRRRRRCWISSSRRRTRRRDLNIETPAVRQLTQSMEARHAQLKKYYDSGADRPDPRRPGQVRDQNLVPLPERNAARKLVAEENADRANLYREIATANGHPEWEADIRTTFAERWASKAPPGWYYQDESGAWKQK